MSDVDEFSTKMRDVYDMINEDKDKDMITWSYVIITWTHRFHQQAGQTPMPRQSPEQTKSWCLCFFSWLIGSWFIRIWKRDKNYCRKKRNPGVMFYNGLLDDGLSEYEK